MIYASKWLVCCALVLATTAIEADEVSSKRSPQAAIAAKPLGDALEEWAVRNGKQLMFDADLAAGKRTQGVAAGLSEMEALSRLLEGTGLVYRVLNERTISILPREKVSAADVTQTSEPVSYELKLAQASSVTTPSSAGESRDSNTVLEEILVTATRRLESARNIPLSLSVIGSQEIERRSLVGMEDYLRSIPGVNQIDNGPLSNAIVIRGITTSPEFENFYSGTTVASYFDETPITAAAGPGLGGVDIRPVDLARIEVLRGPQGTAYGSSSLGGALRLIPQKPQLDGFSGRLAASLGNTSGFGSENSMVQGVLNLPLVTDQLAVRAVGYRYDESGVYRNNAGLDAETLDFAESIGLGDFVRGYTQNDVGRLVSTGGRVAALWQATDKLDLTVTFLTQQLEQNGSPVASTGRFQQARIPIDPRQRVRGESGEVNDTDMDLASLVLHYDLGWAALTSAASWIDSESVWTSSLSLFDFVPSANSPSDFRSLTAETRLASQLEGRLQFLAGLYYENIDTAIRETDLWPGTPDTNPAGFDPMYLYQSSRELDQRAAFAELSYHLTDQLTATVGGRYFKYDKDERTLQEGGYAEVAVGEGVAEILSSGEDGTTFKANLSYQPRPNTLLYASWAEGFRLGRPDPGVFSTCDGDGDGLIDGTNISVASTRQVDSDFLENYELGGKLTTLNGRLALDASVYHINWDGLPIKTLAPGSDPFCGYTANAGSAESNGVEVQASLLVADGLRLDFGGGYTRAKLADAAPEQGWPQGARLPGSPRVSANLAAQYDFELAGRKAFVRTDSFYTGSFYGDLLETPNTAAGDYIKLDARAGIAFQNFSVELFVRNLTNVDDFTWRSTRDCGELFGYRLRPRTIGLQLGYHFE